MRKFYTLSLLLVFFGVSAADAQVFKCVDADGRITYTNDRSASKGCSVVENQNVSSIPSTPRSGASSGGTSTTFPKISPDAQRARDEGRRQILELELSSEERELAAAQKALTEQEGIRNGDERNFQRVLDRLQPFKDKVELHQRNIEALRKEINGLR